MSTLIQSRNEPGILFKHGKEVDRMSGSRAKTRLGD